MTKQERKKAIIVFSLIALVFMIGSILTGGGGGGSGGSGGAIGHVWSYRFLGAGGGGCLLFYVPKEKQPAVRNALSDLYEVDFRFENEGTKIICNY